MSFDSYSKWVKVYETLYYEEHNEQHARESKVKISGDNSSIEAKDNVIL